MATFQQNLAKIRGEAIYGPDMRTAIAEAIEQADDQIQSTIITYEGRVNNSLNAYKDAVDTAVGGVTDRLDTMKTIIHEHLFYIRVDRIDTTNDYIVNITEGEAV